ncbi:MAG: hypothetical protein AAFO07_17515 [Bacteroidota bacterium]
MDYEEKRAAFLGSINQYTMGLIDEFIKLTENDRVIDWNDLSYDEYLTAFTAHTCLDDFDGKLENAVSAYLKAHEKGYEAMERAYVNFVTERGIEIPVVPEKYFSSEEEYEAFKQEANDFAYAAYNRGYEDAYPIRRNEQTGEKYTVQ